MVRSGIVVAVFSVILAVPSMAQPEAFVARVAGEGVEGVYIDGVPDASQPPPNPLGFGSVDDWCAPLAAANAIVFLDQVAGADWALKVTGGLSPGELSAYLGYFMATNGEGSPDRLNVSSRRPGTLNTDISPGIAEFAVWPGERPPGRMWKERYRWRVDLIGPDAGFEALWDAYCESIEKGIPAILCFAFWNPIKPSALEVALLGPEGEKSDTAWLTFYEWGDPITSTALLRKEDPKIPEEEWDEKWGIGHAVTGVGFLRGDPDGRGPLPEGLWVIVHDNWSTTPENVVIPWAYVVALIRLLPA